MYDAIKKGFAVAKGKYFMWINSDDFLIDNYSLLRAYNYLRKYKREWIISNTSFTDDLKKIKTNSVVNNFFSSLYIFFNCGFWI